MLLHSCRSSPYEPGNKKKLQIYGNFLRVWGQVMGVGTSMTQQSSTTAARSSAPQKKVSWDCYDQGGRRTDVDHHSTTSISYTFNKLKLPSLSQMAHSRLLATLSNRSISCICKGQMEAVFPVHLVLFLPKPSPSTAGSTGCSGRLSGSSTGQTLPPKLW